MNEEEIKKIARETFIENVMNNLDSAIIFKYIQELEQENARLKDKMNDIKKILNSNHDVEHIYCALSQYLNIFDYELDLEDYLKEN